MNLTKTIHDHLFENASSIVDGNLIANITQCPLGHSSCYPSQYVNMTITAYNTNRTTDLTTNLMSKSHKHNLQKKTVTQSDAKPCLRSFSNGSPLLMECDLGHSNCRLGQEIPVTVYLIAISGFGSGEAILFASSNLIKMPHAHTVALSSCSITRESVTRILETCPASHTNCILDSVAAVTAWSMTNVTTSEEGG